VEQHKEVLLGSNLFREGMEIFINRVEEAFQLDYHSHDFIEIAFVSEGRGYHHIGDQVQAVSKGDLFVLPIGTTHVFRPTAARGGQKLIVYNCVFTESVLQEASLLVKDIDLAATLRLTPSSREEGYGFHDLDLEFEPLFQTMHEEHSSNRPGSAAVLFSLVVRLLVQIARKLLLANNRTFEDADPIGQAVDYIRRHSAENLSIRSMAEMCRMSERHFFRLFRQRTGQTFHDFLQHARIQSACELLVGTRHKIAVIAETVGYRDLQSFNRVFKRIVGMTPREKRKLHCRA
jgi:AraC family L-rhamnose operon transcriptional activator RhaR